MSGPFFPPANAQTANGQRPPMMLPPGQTYKPFGGDRVPQGTQIPQRSDGSNRVRAANQAGVRPEQLTQPPGYQPPRTSSTPRPQAPPVRTPQAPVPAPELPRPAPPPTTERLPGVQQKGDPNYDGMHRPPGIPLPMPKPSGMYMEDAPAGAFSTTPQNTPLNAPPPPPQAQGDFVTKFGNAIGVPQIGRMLGLPDLGIVATPGDAMKKALEYRINTDTVKGDGQWPDAPPPPSAKNNDRVPLTKAVAAANQKKATDPDFQGGAFPQAKPVQTRKFGPDVGPQMVPKKNPIPSEKQSSKEDDPLQAYAQAPPQKGNPNPNAPPAYKPTQQVGPSGYQMRPETALPGYRGKNPVGAPKQQLSNKAAKSPNMEYYYKLGVTPPAFGKNSPEMNKAIKELIARALSDPKSITRDEDKWLAQNAREGFNKPIDEESVLKRFQGYGYSADQMKKAIAEGRDIAVKKKFNEGVNKTEPEPGVYDAPAQIVTPKSTNSEARLPPRVAVPVSPVIVPKAAQPSNPILDNYDLSDEQRRQMEADQPPPEPGD